MADRVLGSEKESRALRERSAAARSPSTATSGCRGRSPGAYSLRIVVINASILTLTFLDLTSNVARCALAIRHLFG